jgi:hypothetical protein
MFKNWTRKFYEEEPGAGGGGSDENSWMDGLPDDMKGNATLQDIKSVEALAKRFIDTKAMVGNSVRIPGEDAPAEDMVAFRKSLIEKNVGLMAVPDSDNAEAMAEVYKAMGQPDDATGYARPENWAGMTDERFGFLTAEAHKAGMGKAQFNNMTEAMAKEANTAQEDYAADHQAGMDTLKGEWGRAYDQKITRATNMAKQLGAPERLQEAMISGKVDAETLRWFDSISDKLGKEGNSLVSEEGSVSEHTPTELKERVAELTKKMLDMDANDPAYQGLIQKRLKYQMMLTPEKK